MAKMRKGRTPLDPWVCPTCESWTTHWRHCGHYGVFYLLGKTMDALAQACKEYSRTLKALKSPEKLPEKAGRLRQPPKQRGGG